MAFALEQDDIWVRVLFKDRDEQETGRSFQIRWNTDLATTITGAITLVTAIAALSKSEVAEFSLLLPHIDGAASVAADTAENNEVGKIVMSLAVDPPTALNETSTIGVPAPADGIRLSTLGPGSNIIDLTDSAVTDILAVFATGGQGYLSHGQDALTLLKGYVHHARSKVG